MQKKVPYVAQLGNMDCSIACMTMLFRYYGLDVDIVDVGQVVHIGRDGVNLTQLKQATQQFGFKCTAYRYNKQKNILDSNLPAVVYSGSHLAVIGSKTVLGQYILLDPIKGKSIVNFEQIHDTFSDILITIRPEKRIKRKKCKPKLKVAINYKLVAGIISLMLLIQALTLSIPLVEQALIDSITQSQSLLNSAYILVGCIVIAGLYFFLSIARQKLMLRLDISFVKEIMTKMLKKLFDIDPSFFEWHAVGEIVNRFSNVQAINNIIINTFSQVAVQIITSTICLVTMFVYSPSLSVITIAIGTIELVLLLGINKKNREDTSKYIADQSNMQGLLAEAIGNIIEIRCMGMEKAIYKNLTNQFLDELESFRKKSNTGNQMLAISSTITLIFPLIIYILGYSSVVNEALTIGQLIAYVTLANYFISPFVSIVIALPNLNFVYKVVYTAEHYYRGCMFKRNRHLVDNSSVCICYLTSDHGGTAYTVRYAQSQQLRLSIWPTAYRLSFPFRRLRFQFTAILGISEPDTFHEIGCKLAVKKIIRRCVSVSIPPIPEVESQPGDPFRSTGLPAVIDTIWADTILFKVKDFLDVVPGIAADTHDIEKGFVVGIILSRLLEHHIIKCQMFPILKTNF